MCSAPAVRTFTSIAARSSADVVTGGLAEIGGASKKLGEATANVVSPLAPKSPTLPTTAADSVNLGPPQKTSPITTTNPELEAAQRAKKAAALRAGIMSTIGPNLGSIGNTTPKTAYATGMKTALGQ